MKLYYNPISPNCHKVLVALYEKNIPFEGQVVNVMDPVAHAAYKKDVNPLGKVPFLALESGWKIPESSIIVEYLDTHFDTGPRLIPADKDLARRVRFIDRINDIYIVHNLGWIVFDPMKPQDKQSPNAVAAAREQLAIALGLFEKEHGGKKYVVGDEFTFADISASAAIGLAMTFGFPLYAYPNAVKYANGIRERASWQRVLKDAEPVLKQMRGG